ncbi:UNVERIFIED_CONTAM: hypothetical protein GTU68_006166, partial [Idotea baltica]|nr:hypothetical protein [Idotea baltica]
YEFAYGVSDSFSGLDLGHSERREGDRTEGEYHVALPDGRTQRVTYYVDEWGYHPTITYEGEARYPEGHLEGKY